MARFLKIIAFVIVVPAIYSCSKKKPKIFTPELTKVIRNYGHECDEGQQNNFYINLYEDDKPYKNQRVLRIQGYHPDINIPEDLNNHFKIAGYNVLLYFNDYRKDIAKIDSAMTIWENRNGIVKMFHPVEWTVLVGKDNKVNQVLKNTGYMPMDSLETRFNIKS